MGTTVYESGVDGEVIKAFLRLLPCDRHQRKRVCEINDNFISASDWKCLVLCHFESGTLTQYV